MASNEVWRNLAQFIEQKIGEPLLGKNHFAREDDLYHDLHLEPPQIQALIEEWALTFNVDIANFNVNFYHPTNELNNKKFLKTILLSLISKKARETIGGHALTLGMLEDAMIVGKWK